ncbi:MAG: type IV pilus secretin PilQ [Nitrospirae bacterium]|nr:type IV pilus secretin PilQ [Nitrospirota bacterium]
MKISSWFLNITSLGVLSVLLISCGTMNAMKTGARDKNKITNITVMDFAEKTEITIEGESPISYTAFTLTEPMRYVIDLSDVSAGNYKDKIDVNLGTVTSIVPIETDKPFKAVRLEIGMMKEVEPAIRKEGSKLLVDIPKGIVAPAVTQGGNDTTPSPAFETSVIASTTTEPVPPVDIKPEPIAPPVVEVKDQEVKTKSVPVQNVVEAVKVNSTDQGLDVIISGDFVLPKVFKMKGNRLVVDIDGATQSVRPLIQKINLSPLTKIRVGQHPKPKKVRIVLDLSKDTPYTTDPGEKSFTINLGREAVTSIATPPSKTEPEVKTGKEPVSQTEPSEKEALEEPQDLPPVEQSVVTPAPRVAKKSKVGNVLFVQKTIFNKKKFIGERIFLDFQDMEIANALRIISEVSGLNFLVGDDVKGKINVKLKNVPWDQALDLILRMNNLGQIREGNILRIASLGNITKQQDDELKAKDSQIKAEDLVVQIIHVSYAKASDMVEPLKKNMSPRGEITVDARTNSLIIKDIEKSANQVSDLVRTLDSPTPQVLIESRIVQVSPNYTQSLGVMWGVSTTQNNGVNRIGISGGQSGAFNAQTPDFAVNLPAASSFGAIGFNFGRLTGNPLNLDLRLSAGEARGLTKIISTPKIAVLDNMEAKIEQGESIPYATTSLQGTQTTFVDANLTLTVTPHVTADGSIIMKINTSKNAPGSTRQGAAGPSILKKQATTNILVKDGDTAVIGGIYETSKAESTSSVPILSKIPILGWLFKNHQVDESTSELLVFLTPKILK